MNPFLRTLPVLAGIVLFAAAPGALATDVGGTLAADTAWTLAGSPYVVTSTLTVASNTTLTIAPGVAVQFRQGTGMTVRGRLLAEGTSAQRILFTRAPGATSWTRLDFTAGPAESRIVEADIEYAASSGNVRGSGTALHLEKVVWRNTSTQLLDLSNTSIRLLDSVLPTISGAELYHQSGVPAAGHAVVRGNVFGSTTGLNDIIDFTGGQRPGAILDLQDNVFLGASDDVLDLDGTDAHVEGNVFLHVHAGQGPGAADTASAVSGGSDGSRTSRITVVRNLFYDCDHGILAKEGNFYVVRHNTFVGMQQALVNFDEPLRSGITPGAGVVFEDNLAWHSPTNFKNAYLNDPVEGTVALRVRRNLLQGTDRTNDVGNLSLDPLFVGTNGVTAENIRALFALQASSPAKGRADFGLDLGALVPAGAVLSGAPSGTTTNRSATIRVGGPGVVAYQWRLNGGSWSDPAPLTNSFAYATNLFDHAVPISLSGLTNGTYTLQVVGRNSAGVWQADSNAAAATWTVDAVPADALVVGGTLTSNTVWSAQRTILVASTVTVPTNRTLTLSPGAEVRLAAGASILAQAGGRIVAQGTAASPIRLRPAHPGTIWGRLGAEGTNASLTLKRVEIDHGQVAVLNGATGLVERCYFHDYLLPSGATLYTAPILVSERAKSLMVRSSHFRNYHETLFRYGVIQIEDSLFEDVAGDAVDFDGALPGSFIRRSTFRRGPATNIDAVDLGSGSAGVLVESCLMHDFPYDKGVSIGEKSSNIVVRGCLIYGVDKGVAVKDSSTATLVQNTIAASATAVSLYQKTAGQGGGHATGWNNIFWGNTNSVEQLDGSTFATAHSDVEGGYPGTGNLAVDPLFRAAALRDYRLLAGSPARGGGTNGTAMGAMGIVGSSLVDTDGDGLPDSWERAYDLDFNLADAVTDTDQDGHTALEEFTVGTDPSNPGSALRIIPTATPGVIDIPIVAGHTYLIEYRTNLTSGSWLPLTSIPALQEDLIVTLNDTPGRPQSARFFRVVHTSAP